MEPVFLHLRRLLKSDEKIQLESWYKRQTTITEPITTANVVEVKLSLFFRSFTN